jgi:hypothetical protein
LDSDETIRLKKISIAFLSVCSYYSNIPLVGSVSNQKPIDEDCGDDPATSFCHLGQFKVNIVVKCSGDSSFSIVHKMKGSSSGESSILVMGMGATGTHWKYRTPQIIADSAGYMSHLFNCRENRILNAGEVNPMGFYGEWDEEKEDWVEQGEVGESALRLGNWEYYRRAGVKLWMKSAEARHRFFGI